MSTDFDELVAALRFDAAQLQLPAPDQLRSAGDARTKRRVVALARVMVVVVALLAGVAVVVTGIRKPNEPGNGTTPTSTMPAPTTATTTPVPHVAGAPCTSADLLFVNELTDGAMGSVGTVFTVRNRGDVSCRLNGVPTLHYITASGSTAQVPVESFSTGQPVLLSRDATATLLVVYPNAYAGYSPDDPKCQQPVTYAHLSAVLDDGSAIGLGSTQIVIDCGGPIREGPWSPTP